MDDKLRTPTNVPDSLNTNRPLQPFPQSAYQQAQRSEPVDTQATLPHLGGMPPIGQSPKKSRGKAIFMIILTLLMLGAVAAAGVMYLQMADAQRQADAAHQELASLKSENDELKKGIQDETVADIKDDSAAYGKMYYKMLTSYSLITDAEAGLSSAELAADKLAIEKAYKEHYKLPATDEPLKNKQIEVMTIYKEENKTRAIVYVTATADDGPSLIPFVRDGTTWKHAAPAAES